MSEMKEAADKVDAVKDDLVVKLTQEEQEKKDQQRAKIDKVTKKCDGKKAEAAELFKIGQYAEAVLIYKSAAVVLESAVEDYPLFEKELKQYEASIFNNIAACAKKELNTKMEIEYTTKVLERQQYMSDANMLMKAYLRRGHAYADLEKFL